MNITSPMLFKSKKHDIRYRKCVSYMLTIKRHTGIGSLYPWDMFDKTNVLNRRNVYYSPLGCMLVSKVLSPTDARFLELFSDEPEAEPYRDDLPGHISHGLMAEFCYFVGDKSTFADIITSSKEAATYVFRLQTPAYFQTNVIEMKALAASVALATITKNTRANAIA